jgi:uncharacterized protein YpmB
MELLNKFWDRLKEESFIIIILVIVVGVQFFIIREMIKSNSSKTEQLIEILSKKDLISEDEFNYQINKE